MEAIVDYAVSHMSGWDFILAFALVLIDEYPIKKIIFKSNEKYKMVYKLAPIVLGTLAYLVYALVTKSTWYMGAYHGAMIGLCSMGCYDVILKTGKEKGMKGLEEINNAIKEEVNK